MLCAKCGTQVNTDTQNCPSCGALLPSLHAVKKPMPFWFKIIAILAVIALIGVTAGILFTERLVDTVDNQLSALKRDDINQAYYDYTAKDFQQTTSLEEFRHFIKSYPIFIHNQSAHFTERNVKDHVGTLKGHLTSEEHVKIPVEYKLIKEEGKWKILSIRLLQSPTSTTPPPAATVQDLIQVVKGQLQAIEKGDLEKSYQDYTSKEFKEVTNQQTFEAFINRYPILLKHTSASFHKPTIRQNVYMLPVILNSADSAAYIKYYLIKEEGAWKIWSIRILSPTEETKKEKASSPFLDEENSTDPQLSSVQLGLLADQQGLIQKPLNRFKTSTGDVYANVVVQQGVKGDNVNLNFQHLDSRSSILATAPIEQTGHSTLVTVFSPPPTGWPAGIYQLAVTMNDLVETIDFEIE